MQVSFHLAEKGIQVLSSRGILWLAWVEVEGQSIDERACEEIHVDCNGNNLATGKLMSTEDGETHGFLH